MMNVCKGFQFYLCAPVEVKGIGSILSEVDLEAEERSSSSSKSLRRTLSANVLSQGWMSRENSLRKSCSFYELSRNSCSESEEPSESESEEPSESESEVRSEEQEDGDIFSMTDEEEKEEKESDVVDKGCGDLWSLMQSEKKKDSNASFFSLMAPISEDFKVDRSSKWEPCKPYVHPAKKKCKLSDQSLRLCTESLGCESGADCSYPSLSDTDDCSSAFSEDNSSIFGEEKKIPEDYSSVFGEEENILKEKNAKISENVSGSEQEKEIKSNRSFPPPLSSIARTDGPCIHMRSFKQDGRLLLKAVQVETSQKYLRAHREDGRLQIHLISTQEPSEKIQPDHDESEAAAEDYSKHDLQQQQFKSPSAFSLLSNQRRHILRAEYQNPSRNKEFPVNLDLNSTAKLKLNTQVQGSNLAFSKEMNSFTKLPCATAEFEEVLQERPSLSLISSPTLLYYNLQNHSSHAGHHESRSLPKFACNEYFRRCQVRQWQTKPGEPRCIAIS